MKKILITGGAGFIGSHLTNFLLKKGYFVTCYDNLFTGNINNIKTFSKNRRFKFKKADINKKINISKNDFIFNLACPASPKYYQLDPIKTIKTNVLGAINILDYASKYNTPILQASTSEIYGNPKIHPQTETYWGNVNPIGIRSCYDEGKRCAETLFFDYHREKKLKIKVIRIFNTYGPNMQVNDGRVVSNFIVQAINNKPITIYGDGKHTRSFCYVDDLILGMYKCMQKNKSFKMPINLGNPKEISIKYLAKLILDLTKSKSKLTYKNLPQDDPTLRKPDINLAKKNLNWSPKIDIETGLKRTINYFKSL